LALSWVFAFLRKVLENQFPILREGFEKDAEILREIQRRTCSASCHAKDQSGKLTL
jgi:hypothetical protein